MSADKQLLNPENCALEIEERGVSHRHNNNEAKKENSYLSASLVNISVDIGNEKAIEDGYLTGVFMMLATVT